MNLDKKLAAGNKTVEETYNLLLARHEHKPRKINAAVEVEDRDADPCCGRPATFMYYESCHVVPSKGAVWLLGLGRAPLPTYLGKIFVRDILAIELLHKHSQSNKYLENLIGESKHHKNTLVSSMPDGGIATMHNSKFCILVEEALAHQVGGSSHPFHTSYLEGMAHYDPRIADILASSIEKVLGLEHGGKKWRHKLKHKN